MLGGENVEEKKKKKYTACNLNERQPKLDKFFSQKVKQNGDFSNFLKILQD